MGLEAHCEARWGDEVAEGLAHLDDKVLSFRGGSRLKIALADIRSAEARRGQLEVKYKGGSATFALGAQAEAWALKIRYPRGRLDKLGVKPGARVAVLGLDDDEFRRELATRTDDTSFGRAKKDCDIVVLFLDNTTDLPRLERAKTAIKKGGAVWVVWPKGQKAFREDDARAHGKRIGLVDVKVMSFSDKLSGLKMVIPLKDR